MTDVNGTNSAKKIRYQPMLILVLVFAALSSGMRDLDRLQEMVTGLPKATSAWIGDGMASAFAKEDWPLENSCATTLGSYENSDQFRWNGTVSPGKSIEIKGISGDINAEPSAGNQVEVLATKKGRRNDPNGVEIKVIEHAGGVTICALYPSADAGEPNTCEPGKGGHMNVRNNDVRVDFTVKVPVGVGLSARTVNGEINASALSGNVDSRTVNGSIKISTSGYAQAKTVNGEISAKLGDANWPGTLEFKTVNGEIDLALPSATSTQVSADTFNGAITSDFPLAVLGSMSRRHLSGTIGAGGRELVLKTLNGGINLRRAE